MMIACGAVWGNDARAQVDVGLTAGLDEVPAARLRSGAWVGAGASGGRLALRSAQAGVAARVDLMPTLLLGADLWTSEEYGLLLRGSVGLNAPLALPPEYGDQELSFRQSHALVGALRRWHLSAAPDALAISAGVGLRAQVEETPPQRPTYLVDRLALGPAALLGVTAPLSSSLTLGGRASASTHVLVQEDPADSGALSGGPLGALAWDVALELSWALSPALALLADAEWRSDRVRFSGFGTRALGVYDAETTLAFWTTGVALRVALR